MDNQTQLQILYLEHLIACTQQRIKNGEKGLEKYLLEYLDSLSELEEWVREKTLKVLVGGEIK